LCPSHLGSSLKAGGSQHTSQPVRQQRVQSRELGTRQRGSEAWLSSTLSAKPLRWKPAALRMAQATALEQRLMAIYKLRRC
jgi:hypothetical protein